MKLLQENKDITHLSNYKTPAKTRWYFEVHKEEDIKNIAGILIYARENNLPILWISWGTNMLFAFDIYKGIVIKNSLKWWTYNIHTKVLETYGSESIWEISQALEREYGQDLWHRFIGLPGSVAGAIYWNAGCFGLETGNNFESCKVLDLESWKVFQIEKKDMNFEYRTSLLKREKKYFLISAKFNLSKKVEKYHSDTDNIDFRENKQPKGNSCGSFFKNPSKETSAWFLIEQVWLKWHKIGGAYFSDIHANFLMHDGFGTYTDMLRLIDLAQKKVQQKYKISLENEVQIITNLK